MLLVMSEQRHLPVRAGAFEAAAIKVEGSVDQAMLFAGSIKAIGDQIGNRPRTTHAGAKFRLIGFTIAHLTDQGHHFGLAVRVMGTKPFFEKVRDFKR